MDYSLITEEAINERFESLPEHIQELITTEQVEKLVSQIGKSHFLGRDKVEILEQIVTLILLGFINLRDLKQVLSEHLFLNYAHTIALAKELQTEIFAPIRGDLEQIYEPLEVGQAEVASEEADTGEDPKAIQDDGSFDIPVEEEGGDEEGKPLILHEGVSVEAAGATQGKFGDLSKAFSFFRQKKQEGSNLVTAKIESPKSDEKKTVHYSELRTPVTPFSEPAGSGFINLEAFGKPLSVQEQATTPKPGVDAISPIAIQTPTEEKEVKPQIIAPIKTAPEAGVTLEGNKINLRS